ncbi:hypothetical protein [Aeromonas sp. AE23HZ002T15]
MARDNKYIQGLDDLEALLDSLQDPKFRARALRNAAKQTMEPVKQELQKVLPSIIKPEDVIIKTTVNTTKKLSIPKSGNVSDKKSSELYTEVTFRMSKGDPDYGGDSAYGMMMILENGRRESLAKIGKGKTFKVYGKVTAETHRYIGTTQGRYIVKRLRFEEYDKMAADFSKYLTQEIDNEIKKQDKRNKRGK